jgi:hypothetical protein
MLFVVKVRPNFSLEMELQCKLYLPRGARRATKHLTKGAAGQNQIAIGHRKRGCVGRILGFHAKLEIADLVEAEALAERQIKIEKRRTGKEITAHIAKLSGLGARKTERTARA